MVVFLIQLVLVCVVVGLVVSAIYYFFIKTVPKKVYIVDLVNRPEYTDKHTEKDTVYLGCISSDCGDVRKYSDWKKCYSRNFITAYKNRGPKLLYHGCERDVNSEIVSLLPGIVRFVKECCSSTATVKFILKNRIADDRYVRGCFDDKRATDVKIEYDVSESSVWDIFGATRILGLGSAAVGLGLLLNSLNNSASENRTSRQPSDNTNSGGLGLFLNSFIDNVSENLTSRLPVVRPPDSSDDTNIVSQGSRVRRFARRSNAPDNTAYVAPSRYSPIKIYIIDLENKPAHSKVLLQRDTVYLGFIGSERRDVEMYLDWKKCTSANFVSELSSGGPKFYYVVKGSTPQLVDNRITELVPNFVKYIKLCCSPTSTVYLVSGDKSMKKTESKLKLYLRDNGMDTVTVERITYDPFLSLYCDTTSDKLE